LAFRPFPALSFVLFNMIKPILLIAAVLALLVVLLVLGKIRRTAFLTLAGLIVVVGALVIIKFSQFAAMGAMQYAPPPDTVTTAPVAEATWQPLLSSVGSLTAVQGVTVAAQLDGNVTKITFTPGSAVKAGDLLVQQDTSSEEAQLHSLEAATELARLNLGRSHQLLADATISQAQFDTDNANYQQALSQADNIRASIAKKTIRAPFTGRLGIRLVNLGQTLKAGDPIVSLQALNPIYADFWLPQQELALIAQGTPVRVSGEAVPGGAVEGKITAINPDVDNATRNVRVEATLANASESLHPGMFVKVSVELPDRQKVLVIPATAVLYAPYGNSVFVISEAKDAAGQTVKSVHQQFVRLGETRGDFVAVTGGLKAGDEVVSAGSFKLRNGEAVVVNNTLAPPAQLAPKPDNS
jgi:membrane fusion protein (multidrug efflux system)